MQDKILNATIVSIIFFLLKFVQMRFINKESKPLKPLAIDSVIVFVASLLGIMLLEQFSNVSNLIGSKDSPNAFVSSPEF